MRRCLRTVVIKRSNDDCHPRFNEITNSYLLSSEKKSISHLSSKFLKTFDNNFFYKIIEWTKKPLN